MNAPPYGAALITGASSGIGAELARQLAALGVAVGLVARRSKELSELKDEIQARGGRASFAAADVGDREALADAINRLSLELGPIDLLVANAGVGRETSALAWDSRDLEWIMRVNVLGVAYAIEAVLPSMLERGRGHLVGVSSLAGYRGFPKTAAYCASKAALSTMLESLRVDLLSKGIAVTTVHPGYVHTPMTADFQGPKPFLMDAESACRVILRGIIKRKREINFPWPLARLVGMIHALPGPVYDWLAQRESRRAENWKG